MAPTVYVPLLCCLGHYRIGFILSERKEDCPGHSAKMSFYSVILYPKCFDCGVSPEKAERYNNYTVSHEYIIVLYVKKGEKASSSDLSGRLHHPPAAARRPG
jgi:hypothetical protein